MIRPITLAVPGGAREGRRKVRAFISVELSMGQMMSDIGAVHSLQKPVILCSSRGMIPTPENVLAALDEAGKIEG